MNCKLIKITVRRFFELMVTCSAISAVITFLNIVDLLTTKSRLCIALLIGLAVFLFINVRMLRQCYFEFRSNVIYFLVNMSAYLLFAGATIAVYCLCSKEWFTWLFAVTKFAKYWGFNINNLLSLFLFHIIGLLTVIFAPTGMSWIFIDDNAEEAD